jgi:hypothetical protein
VEPAQARLLLLNPRRRARPQHHAAAAYAGDARLAAAHEAAHRPEDVDRAGPGAEAIVKIRRRLGDLLLDVEGQIQEVQYDKQYDKQYDNNMILDNITL